MDPNSDIELANFAPIMKRQSIGNCGHTWKHSQTSLSAHTVVYFMPVLHQHRIYADNTIPVYNSISHLNSIM